MDGYYSITDQDTAQTLNLVLPSQELADNVCKMLNEVFNEGFESGLRRGYSNGIAQG